jgi:hypothetical protein
MVAVVAFCATTFASECINCVCPAKQENKSEKNCCSKKTEKKCCSNETKCEDEAKKDCDNCMHCVIKKNDIKNSATTNDNKISNYSIFKISDLSSSPVKLNLNQPVFNQWRPPDKISKIFLTLSNFRI